MFGFLMVLAIGVSLLAGCGPGADGGIGIDEVELSTGIGPEHYAGAGGMMQPYPGLWESPKKV